MVIRLLGREFVDILSTMVSAKQVINFTVKGKRLYAQIFDPVIHDKIVKINEIMISDEFNTISVEMDGSYNLIDNDEVVLTIEKDSLMISSTNFRCSYKAVYEERFEVISERINQIQGRVTTFSHLSRIAQGVTNVAKSIHVDPPAIVFKDKKAYMILSNIAYCMNTDFMDMIMPVSHMRAINKVLTRSAYSIDIHGEAGNYARIKYDEDGSSLCFMIRQDHSETTETIENIVKGLKLFGKSNTQSISDMVIVLDKVYKDLPINMYISEKGFRVELSKSSSSYLTIGDTGGKEFITVRSTVPILSLINRIFKDTLFDVLIGGRYVCLKSKEEYLLLTGLQ